jgi:segregation and condensation protein B
MSLKAKLEAVIYAAEEPVTLAQLAAVFTADALEWKAEQEAASAAQAAESASQAGLNSETLFLLPQPAHEQIVYMGLDEALATALPDETPASAPDNPVEAAADPNPEASAEPAEAAAVDADAELEVRRLARQRDREVRAVIRQLLDELIASYASDERGVEIREIAGGFRMATKPECHDAVRAFVKSLKPALKLSLPALETLAVIAYKQPVTAPEVNEIRGVDSSGVFGSLLARKLIATAGRKQVIGRPILYKTTREFLLRFGLKDVAELPSMEEFEKMADLEFDEAEPLAEAERMSAEAEELSLELDEADTEELPGEVSSAPDETPELVGQGLSPDIGPEKFTGALAPEGNRSGHLATIPSLPEPTQTAATADSNEPQDPAEAAPAETVPTEQAETENSPNGEEIHQG